MCKGSQKLTYLTLFGLLVALEMYGDAVITYYLTLWHESLNQPVLELKGNNSNLDDDTLELPTPTLLATSSDSFANNLRSSRWAGWVTFSEPIGKHGQLLMGLNFRECKLNSVSYFGC